MSVNSTSLATEYAALLQPLQDSSGFARSIGAAPSGTSAFDYLSNMSHELRTPLGTMMGFSQLLSEHHHRPLSDSDIAQYAHLIHQASADLLSVIDRVLEFSRIQSGTLELNLEDLRLADIVLASIEEKQMAAREAGIRLDYSIASGVPLVRADEARMRQVLAHLIDDAIEFSEAGGLVHVAAVGVPGGAALLVRDTGIGTSPEDTAGASTSRGLADRSRTRIGRHAGLGLEIVKGIVRLHGGRVRITNKPHEIEVIVALPTDGPAKAGDVVRNLRSDGKTSGVGSAHPRGVLEPPLCDW